jgi:hypothetical protein
MRWPLRWHSRVVHNRQSTAKTARRGRAVPGGLTLENRAASMRNYHHRALLLIASAVVGAVCGLAPRTAEACLCAEQTREEQVAEAVRILRGTVRSLEYNSGAELATVKVNLAVSEVWKGRLDETASVYVSGFDPDMTCGYPLVLGRDYIVYVTEITEQDGRRWPYTSSCHLTQPYSEEEAALLGPGTFVGPTPTVVPTLPVCPVPTTAPPAASATTGPGGVGIVWLPILYSLQEPGRATNTATLPPETRPCASTTPVPSPTATPFYVEPPGAMYSVGRAGWRTGVGSFCWWMTAQCHEAPGIATGPRWPTVTGPVTVRFRLEPERQLSRLELSVARISAADRLPDIDNDLNTYWRRPAGMTPLIIARERNPEVALDFQPGLYVLRLFAQWGNDETDPAALGWVEYGAAIEVMAPSTAPTPISPPTATATPTSTPYYAEPPDASYVVGRHGWRAGKGSFCWWVIGQCREAPDIATGKYWPTVTGPVTMRFRLEPELQPMRLELSVARISAADRLPDIDNDPNAYWRRPAETTPVTIARERNPEVALDLQPGLYVLRLLAQWGTDAADPTALGWVEYGAAIEVVANDRDVSHPYSLGDRTFAICQLSAGCVLGQ